MKSDIRSIYQLKAYIEMRKIVYLLMILSYIKALQEKNESVRDNGGNLIAGYSSSFTTFSPEILSTIQVPFAMAIDKYKGKEYVVVKGDDALVGLTYSSTINTINVSDPWRPQLAGKTALDGYMFDVKMTDDDLAVAVGGKSNKNSSLNVVNAAYPSDLRYRGSIYLAWSSYYGAPPENVPYQSGTAYETALLGGSAYVATQGIGVQAVDLSAVTPPQETAQANAIVGTIMDSSYTAVSMIRSDKPEKNNILAIKNGSLSILSPQLSVVSEVSGLNFPYGVTGVEKFPIDIDNDGNLGDNEDNDGDDKKAVDETFDLALVLTPDGIVVINVTDRQTPNKIDFIPVPTSKIVVDRERRLAYALSGGGISIISLKCLPPMQCPLPADLNRTNDPRLLYTVPDSSGMDMVLSDDGTTGYIADYSSGKMKVVKLGNIPPSSCDLTEPVTQMASDDCKKEICQNGFIVTIEDATETATVNDLAEETFCLSYPIDCVSAYSLKDQSLQWAEDMVQSDPNDEWTLDSLHNGIADAARHAFWMCMTATQFGAEFAKGLGDAHEEDSGRSYYYDNSGSNPCGEKLMDLHNNDIGRSLAVQPGTCEEKVLNSVELLQTIQ